MKDQYNLIKEKLKENKTILFSLSIYTFLFLFFCSKMSPLYPTNEWADVNVYFNVGKGMFSGMTLYSEIFDHKGPLIFIIYGIGSLLSGSSFIGMFVLQVVAWIAAVFAVYFTGRLLLKDITAFIVALLVPLASLSYMHNGGSAEEMILLFAIVSTYFFVAYFGQKETKHKPYYMFVHGVLTAMTFLIKLNLMLFWLFPLLAIFVTLLLQKEFKNFFFNCLAYIGGFALVVFPICLYFLCKDALQEAYHVYIELNKQYSSTDNYSYLITNGISKLYKEYRVHLVWYIIITIGIFHFPLKFIKGWLGKTAFMLSGIALFGIIFFPLTFHFYYPLPLFTFVGLGLISLCSLLEKYITISNSKKVISILAVLLLLIAVNKRNFFNLGTGVIFRQEYPNGAHFQFKDEILEANNPTLLNIAFGDGNALFTTTGITPTEKYFFCPNIYYDMFPAIRDNQTQYIEEKRTEFIVSSNVGFNYEYFKELPILHENYTIIDSCATSRGAVTYYLYKRND